MENGTTTPVAKTPEICVEILSPSNSETEMKGKHALGLEAGALEKWEYDQDGGGNIFVEIRETGAVGDRLQFPEAEVTGGTLARISS